MVGARRACFRYCRSDSAEKEKGKATLVLLLFLVSFCLSFSPCKLSGLLACVCPGSVFSTFGNGVAKSPFCILPCVPLSRSL